MTQTSQYVGANLYRETALLTASRVQTVILLLEKARSLIIENKSATGQARTDGLNQAQNVMAQLQMCLDLENGEAAQDLFAAFDLIWEACEVRTPNSLNLAVYSLEHLLDTIHIRFY